MSQWSGPLSGQNSTGQTIYNVKISQTAPGHPAQTITATHVSNGNSFGGGQWQTAGTARDHWSWAYNLGTATGPLITGSMECNLAQPDGASVIILTSTGAIVEQGGSSVCTGSNH